MALLALEHQISLVKSLLAEMSMHLNILVAATSTVSSLLKCLLSFAEVFLDTCRPLMMALLLIVEVY